MGQTNPFTPTFGKMPAYLAGREQILDDMSYAFENGSGDPNLSTILVGPRGSGKTALLSAIADVASSNGWISANVSASPGMLEDIRQRSAEAAQDLLGEKPSLKVTEIGLAQIVNIGLGEAEQPPANWRTSMNQLFSELSRYDTGLLITVDEVTVNLDEMVQLASVYQHFVRENRKVALIMAGLPFQVSELVDDKRISFLRRAVKRRLARLSDADVENAFIATVEDAGKRIGHDAVKLAVEAAEGFPYMMQLVGYRFWAASRGEEITLQDVERGAAQAAEEFRSGVLETTLSELSPKDVEFCLAMLNGTGPSRLSDIAARMGVKSNYASQYKRRLLLAGVIEERGAYLEFCIPGFRDLLAERFV